MTDTKRIVLTGGGTAGHVTPNLALIPRLRERGYDIHYIGSYNGIERDLIEKIGIQYYGISSGKFRRYFDVKNFTDPFKVVKGYGEALRLIRAISPDILFSKGGFVAVPVVYAAHKRKIPVIIHESDMEPGFANRLCVKKASKICVNFPETLKYIRSNKAIVTGSPIRNELYMGDRVKGLEYCAFTGDMPVLMVTGGSSGSAAINEAVRNLLPTLLTQFQVVHLCGKGKIDAKYDGIAGYRQFEYAYGEFSNMLAMADVVLSRAGANTICELLTLKKPNILVPLSLKVSRGDQIQNAESFEKQGFSHVINEEELTNDTLLRAVRHVYEERDTYVESMGSSGQSNATDTILDLIEGM